MASSLESKILDRGTLLAMTSSARDAGKTIVQCHGCFDIVHPGHVRYLEFARRQGDVLIVSLTGDSEAPEGGQRAYISEALRAESVAALMFVDYVYIDPSPTAESILKAVAPDVYVKGSEYEHSCDAGFLAETAVVEAYGGRIIFSSGEPIFSSTELMERVPNRDQQQSRRLKMVVRRHGITSSTIEGTLDRLRGLHVLVVGDVVLDRYVLCDAMGVASESPMMSLVRRDECEYVGGAAIVARHVAAMGAHAFLLSAGGRDDRSRRVTDVLAAEGVAYQLIDSRPSIVEKVRYVADDTKILKVDCGTRIPLDSVAERHAALILEQQSKVADAVIFCDFGYGMITGGLLSRVLPTLRQNVPVLAADVSGGRVDLAQFQNVDLLCPTERELRMALNDHDSGLSAVAWNLLERTQARHLLVTLEERGVVVFERRNQNRRASDWSARLRSEQLPSFADHALDRLGCGDALLAASTLALATGSSLVQAAYLGNAAAAVEIAMPGNHPVEVDKLREWLRTRPELGFAEAPVSKPARTSAPSSPAIVPL